jgi:RHS repeat-associated protein
MRTQLRPILDALALLALFSTANVASGYYDPGVQRWINRDPMTESGFRTARHGHPASGRAEPNVYAYVVNQPLTEYDPLGLTHQEETDIQSCLDNCLDDRNNAALGAVGKACKHHGWGHIIGGGGAAVFGAIAGAQKFGNLLMDMLFLGFTGFEVYEIGATVSEANRIKAKAQGSFVACCNGCGTKYKDMEEARQYIKDHPLN